MIRILSGGTYTLESDSAGTYHELVASATGSASCKALVRMKRQSNSVWEQVTNQPVDTAVVAAGTRYEPGTAQTGPLHSCVQSGTAIAHVKVG